MPRELIQQFYYNVPAGGSFQFTCDFGYLTNVDCTSTAGLKISIDGGSPIIFRNLQKVPIDREKGSVNVQLINDTGTNILGYVVGHDGGFNYFSATFSGNVNVSVPTTLTTYSDVNVPSAAATQIIAANSSRSEVMIKNSSSNSSIFRVGDSSVSLYQGIELDPGQSMTLSTRSSVYAYQQSGSIVQIQVMEVL